MREALLPVDVCEPEILTPVRRGSPQSVARDPSWGQHQSLQYQSCQGLMPKRVILSATCYSLHGPAKNWDVTAPPATGQPHSARALARAHLPPSGVRWLEPLLWRPVDPCLGAAVPCDYGRPLRSAGRFRTALPHHPVRSAEPVLQVSVPAQVHWSLAVLDLSSPVRPASAHSVHLAHCSFVPIPVTQQLPADRPQAAQPSAAPARGPRLSGIPPARAPPRAAA